MTATRLSVTIVASLVVLAQGGCGKPGAEQSLAAAKAHLGRGEADKAVIELRNALAAKPDSPDARLALGEAYLAIEDPLSAAVELRKVFDGGSPPDSVPALLARAYLESGQAKKVVELDATVRLATPLALAAFKTHVANAHAQLRDAERAESALGAALAASPDFSPALLVRARAVASRGDLAEAGRIVDAILARSPRDVDAMLLRANLQLASGDAPASMATLDQVLAIQPRNVQAHAGLVGYSLEKADTAAAAARLDALRKARPAHALTVYFEGRLALQQGNLAQAEDSANRLLKAAPEHRAALSLAGSTALAAGRLEQADEHFARLLLMAPNVPAARKALARVALKRGDTARTVATLEPLLTARAADAEAAALAGEAQLLAGNAKEAEEQLSRAVRLRPDDVNLKTTLAKARLARGDGAALEELEILAAGGAGDTADLALIAAKVSRRDFGAALKAADRLVARQRGSATSLNLRAQVLAARGDRAAARQGFERALAVDPEHLPSVQALIRLDLLERKPAQARARVVALTERNPRNAEALLTLASIDEQAGKPVGEVAETIRRAIAARPNDPTTRARLVDLHLAARDFPAALTAAQEATAALPDAVPVLDALARAQLAGGELRQAATTFGKLASLRPKSAEPLLGAAGVRMAANAPWEAIEPLKRAVALEPDHPRANRMLVAVYLGQGRSEDALHVAQDLLARHPESALGDELLGDVESVRGRAKAASVAYQAGLRKAPSSSALAARLHGALLASANATQADELARNWLRQHPRDAAFLTHLGTVAVAAKDLDTAEARLAQALSIEADNPAVMNNLAWVLATRRKPGASAMAEKANRLAQGQPAFMDTLAYALASEGKLERAIEVQTAALQINAQAHGLRLHLARIYLQAGDKTSARRELETLARLGDRFSKQGEVQSLIASL